MQQSSGRYLENIRVLDLSQYIPGPFASRQLADLGADVIKVEPPGGDPMRHFMHQKKDEPSPAYRHLNRGKRICKLDLKSDSGKQILTKLLTKADVLLESFRPGVLLRLGFDRGRLKDINPSLIHCALSGYGQTGPYQRRAGHDLNYCAASGALGVSGTVQRPIMTYPPLADHAGAMQASVTILAALLSRQQNNKGAFIDISLFESCLSWQYLPLLKDTESREQGLLNGGAACYNIYQCQDGNFISLAALEDIFWKRFCEAVGKLNWVSRKDESMPQKELIKEVSELFLQQPQQKWDQIFETIDCCYEPVIMPAMARKHVQVENREMLTNNGPVYPGRINDEAPNLNESIEELAENESINWL